MKSKKKFLNLSIANLASSCPTGLGVAISKCENIKYYIPKHIRFLEKTVLSCIEKKIKYLIVSMPPRHGKSYYISRYLPAWFLGTNPKKRVILTSYNSDLSEKFSYEVREIIKKYGEAFFGINISNGATSKSDWRIGNSEGGMRSAGAGAGITGGGGDLIICDDIIKDSEESFSDRIKESRWNWWRSTLRTRLEPGGLIILLGTRWSQNDPIGNLLYLCKKNNFDYIYINIPAIAGENDILNREVGSVLWEERYSKEEILSIKKTIGNYWFLSQYQGSPSSPGGNLFKKDWWKFYQSTPQVFDYTIQSWDMSFKATQSGSYVVGQVWGLSGRNKYLIYQVRKRAEFTETLDMIRHVSNRFPQARTKLVEEKANGAAIISMLSNEIGGFIAINPKESKIARASSVSPAIERGEIFLPRLESFTEQFIEEHSAFPNSLNDDQVDACSQALNYLDERGRDFNIFVLPEKHKIKSIYSRGEKFKFI